MEVVYNYLRYGYGAWAGEKRGTGCLVYVYFFLVSAL